MPVYSFVCPVCGTRFDQRFSFKDDARGGECPHGHPGAQRVYSAPSIVFKGNGFYVTDTRKQPAKGAGND